MQKFSAAAFGLLIPALLALILSSTQFRLIDTDRYYHFALSRQMAEQGTLAAKILPQVEDLGWGEYFLEKEFLFHAFTSLGYRAGGDGGVERIVFLIASLSALVVYSYFLGLFSSLTAFLALFASFFAPAFVFRMLLVRPHVLAVLCFLVIQLGILRRSAWLAGLGGLFYGLAYHTFYFPLFCFVAGLTWSLVEQKEAAKAARRACLFGLGGLGAGLVVNPYFPSNVVFGVKIAGISLLLRNELKDLAFGIELYPYYTNIFLQNLWFPLAVFFGGIWALEREGRARFELGYLLTATAAFLLLCFQSPRASEYTFPLTALLFGVVLARFSNRYRLPAAAMLALVQAAFLAHTWAGEARTPAGQDLNQATWAAVHAIPAEPKGAKVYNCDWDRTPFLFYARPDLRFIDALDPSLLYFSNPRLFGWRDSLRRGYVADAHAMIRDGFGASYVLCISPEVSAQLRSDPGFRQLYPSGKDFGNGAPRVALFEVRKEPTPQFVQTFTLEKPRRGTLVELRALVPSPAKNGERVEIGRSAYVDLRSAAPPSDGRGACAILHPESGELRKHLGARWLAVGGGQSLRVWRNGRLLFSSGGGFPRARASQAVVRLPAPLAAADEIAVMACSAPEAPYWGASLSLWSDSDFAKICEWKRAVTGGEAQSEDALSLDHETCLGELAGEEAPAALRAAHPERR